MAEQATQTADDVLDGFWRLLLFKRSKGENLFKDELDESKKKDAPKADAVATSLSAFTIPDYRKPTFDKQETISRRTFTNETVEVDGKLFDHCHFVNVTLIYHGLAPVTFIESAFQGNTLFGTDNHAAKSFARLGEHLRHMPNLDYFATAEKDLDGNMRIITKEERRPIPTQKAPKPK